MRLFRLIAILTLIVGGASESVAIGMMRDLHKYNWQLLEINGTKLETDDVTLSFDAYENILTGNATCNQFDGYYQANGGYINISASSEQNICDDMAEMHMEDMLLLALNYAKTYAIYGNKLVLFNDIGQRIASFRDNSKKEQKTSFLWLTF
jgi:heat shock protein HslJ